MRVSVHKCVFVCKYVLVFAHVDVYILWELVYVPCQERCQGFYVEERMNQAYEVQAMKPRRAQGWEGSGAGPGVQRPAFNTTKDMTCVAPFSLYQSPFV